MSVRVLIARFIFFRHTRPMPKVLSFLLAFLLPSFAHAQTGAILSHWVQLGPGGIAELRAVTETPSCPDIVADRRRIALHVRAAKDADFPLLCSLELEKGVKSASLGSLALPLPVETPERIAVLGDTGCRIKSGTVQDCNDPAKWPFLRVADEIAKLKPDLVIHVGDYLYRETPCPKGHKAKCGGSPYGDNWPAWNADFFGPAKALLDAAPIVLVRGNHEDCKRAGPGWTRLMSPHAFDPKAPCSAHLPPYAVPLGPETLVVMDDADAPDQLVDTAARDVYRAEFQTLSNLAPAPIWLALHRPIAGAVRLFGFDLGGNRTLLASIGEDDRLLAPVELMLSGHIHRFEALNYEGNLPSQLLAGHGGDKLDTAATDLSGFDLGGWRVKDGISQGGFGFLFFVRQAKGWRIEVRDADGNILRLCRFADRRLDCPAAVHP